MSSNFNLDLLAYSLATDFSGADALWDKMDEEEQANAIKTLLHHHPLRMDHQAKSQIWFYLLEKPWPKLEGGVKTRLVDFIVDVLDVETFERLVDCNNDKSYLVHQSTTAPLKALVHFYDNTENGASCVKDIETIIASSSNPHWLRLALGIAVKKNVWDWLEGVAEKWPSHAPCVSPFLIAGGKTELLASLLGKMDDNAIVEELSFFIHYGEQEEFLTVFEGLKDKDRFCTQLLKMALQQRQHFFINTLLPFSNVNELALGIVSCIEEKDMETLKVLAPYIGDVSDLKTLVSTRAHATNKPEKKQALGDFESFVVKEELMGVLQKPLLQKPPKSSPKKM